ncbi:hypothetical protein DYI37_15340 [Fulvimarina endophytica]|uniref:Uncharacterized protein n=1 Tax=Fulvimarina endophytica TaxID=2293836 RepID=A0A371X068_9HYPH|nr:hypothetical protein DYI37_15340 [Fulvimarina endophytica]
MPLSVKVTRDAILSKPEYARVPFAEWGCDSFVTRQAGGSLQGAHEIAGSVIAAGGRQRHMMCENRRLKRLFGWVASDPLLLLTAP